MLASVTVAALNPRNTQQGGLMKKLGKGCLTLVVAVVVIIIIIVVIVSVSGGGGGSSDNNASSQDSSSGSSSSSSKSSGLDSSAGHANKVKEGSSFQLGDFKIHKGWKVQKIGSGFGYNIKNLQVENTTDSAHQFDVDVKLHKGKHVIVADINCIAQSANPQDIVNVDCLPDGSDKKFDYITIENSL